MRGDEINPVIKYYVMRWNWCGGSSLCSNSLFRLILLLYGRGRLKCDGTRAQTRFRLPAKRTSPVKSAGVSVQSTAGCNFGIKLYVFRTVPLSIIRSLALYTQQWYVTYRFCWMLAVSKPVWQTPLLCVQWKTPDDGQRNCPKHVEFYSKVNLRN